MEGAILDGLRGGGCQGGVEDAAVDTIVGHAAKVGEAGGGGGGGWGCAGGGRGSGRGCGDCAVEGPEGEFAACAAEFGVVANADGGAVALCYRVGGDAVTAVAFWVGSVGKP